MQDNTALFLFISSGMYIVHVYTCRLLFERQGNTDTAQIPRPSVFNLQNVTGLPGIHDDVYTHKLPLTHLDTSFNTFLYVHVHYIYMYYVQCHVHAFVLKMHNIHMYLTNQGKYTE